MDDANQIEVPPSFLALFSSPSGHRLLEPMSTVRTRYELCEDLAQMLAGQAAAEQFKGDLEPVEVLTRIREALAIDGSPVQPAEATWVTRRLAELLNWDAPDFDPAP